MLAYVSIAVILIAYHISTTASFASAFRRPATAFAAGPITPVREVVIVALCCCAAFCRPFKASKYFSECAVRLTNNSRHDHFLDMPRLRPMSW